MGPGAFLSHESAAALWGLSGDRPKVHVNAPRGRQVRPGRRSGIKVHRCKFAADEVTVHDGIPVSTVARTLFDLAERSAPHELKSAWDEADRLKRLRVPEVARVYEVGRWEFHAHRAAFEKDRDRDTDHLLADYRATRVTHRRLSDHPEHLAAQLRTLLTKAGRPQNAKSQSERSISAAIAAVSVGLSPTRTPLASSASFLPWAVPEEPEMIAPAWPICLPGGAVKPAM
jgi:hypothetical protein